MEQFIEALLALVANSVNNLADTLPVGYAFAAGMLATVNPCGFALLPAYISLYLGDAASGTQDGGVAVRLLKGLLISLAVTAGFVLLFGGVGLVIVSGGRFLVEVMPWAGLAVGLLLVLLGLLLLFGKGHLYLGVAARLSAKITARSPRSSFDKGKSPLTPLYKGGIGGILSYFLFGIAYGIASLSCTLPIFLIVVGLSATAGDLAQGMYQFVSYALGMGATLLVLTLGTAAFRGAVGGSLRRAVPYVERASAGLIVLAGAFIVYYWLTIGDLAEAIKGFF